MALGAASLHGTVPTTEEWLQIEGQGVRMDESCSPVMHKGYERLLWLTRVAL